MQVINKTKNLYRLMERFVTQKEISSYDEALLDEFNCTSKTLERYLNEIEKLYNHIIVIKKGHKKVWKLISVSDIFEEFIRNSYDLSQLFYLAKEFDPEIFKELEKGTLSKISKSDEQIFLFKNSMMEELQTTKSKMIFKNLKVAVKNYEYRDIVYNYNGKIVHKNVKCLKLLFVNNNWYVIIVDENKKLLYRRITFIESLSYSSSKTTFRKRDVALYLEFLKNIQNAMTLYGVEKKIATIKANPNIALYFEEGMKKLLPSQKFQEKLNDGSIIFTVEYTQELEVLPFIQKWLPDLVVLEPKELREAYIQKLQYAIENHLK